MIRFKAVLLIIFFVMFSLYPECAAANRDVVASDYYVEDGYAQLRAYNKLRWRVNEKKKFRDSLRKRILKNNEQFLRMRERVHLLKFEVTELSAVGNIDEKNVAEKELKAVTARCAYLEQQNEVLLLKWFQNAVELHNAVQELFGRNKDLIQIADRIKNKPTDSLFEQSLYTDISRIRKDFIADEARQVFSASGSSCDVLVNESISLKMDFDSDMPFVLLPNGSVLAGDDVVFLDVDPLDISVYMDTQMKGRPVYIRSISVNGFEVRNTFGVMVDDPVSITGIVGIPLFYNCINLMSGSVGKNCSIYRFNDAEQIKV